MAWKKRVQKSGLLAVHGLLMLGLGVALFFLGSLMSDPTFEKTGYVAANVVTGICLLIPASLFRMFQGRLNQSSPPLALTWVSALSIACWATFWMVQSPPMKMLPLSLMAGLHGIFWCSWFVRLAYSFQSSPAKAIFLSIVAATVSFLGMILATETGPTFVHVVTTLAGYASYVGIATLGTSIYLFGERAWESELNKIEAVTHGIRQVPARAFAETESMAS